MIRSTAEASHTVGISATQNDTNRQTTNSDASLRRPGLRDDVSNQNYQGVADEDLYFGNILNKENEATVSSRNSSAESMNGVETIKDDDDLDVDEVTPAESTLTQEDLAVLTYGTELQEEFKDDPRPEVAKTLVDTFALIAYPNAMESELRDMLDPSGRSEIAEDVNGAILGKRCRMSWQAQYTNARMQSLRDSREMQCSIPIVRRQKCCWTCCLHPMGQGP